MLPAQLKNSSRYQFEQNTERSISESDTLILHLLSVSGYLNRSIVCIPFFLWMDGCSCFPISKTCISATYFESTPDSFLSISRKHRSHFTLMYKRALQPSSGLMLVLTNPESHRHLAALKLEMINDCIYQLQLAIIGL